MKPSTVFENYLNFKSRLPNEVCILWLRPHRGWAYSKGDIAKIPREMLYDLLGNEEEEIEPYVRFISDEEVEAYFKAQLQKFVTPDDSKMVRVKWFRHHPGFAYKPGDIGKVTQENAELLLKEETGTDGKPGPGPYISILPDDYVEPLKIQKVIPDSKYITVQFIKAHPGFAYSAGDIGLVTPENFQKLSAGGYVIAKPTPKQSFLHKLFTR